MALRRRACTSTASGAMPSGQRVWRVHRSRSAQGGSLDCSCPMAATRRINLAPTELKEGGRTYAAIRKGDSMTRRILVLTAVTFALVFGAIAARARENTDDAAMIRQWEQVQQNPGEEDDTGMTGHGMARHCITAMYGGRRHDGPGLGSRYDGARGYDGTLRHADDFRPYGSGR